MSKKSKSRYKILPLQPGVTKFTAAPLSSFQCYPERVISIDLGKVNSAYALIDSNYQVLEWRMLNLEWPQPFSLEGSYDNV